MTKLLKPAIINSFVEAGANVTIVAKTKSGDAWIVAACVLDFDLKEEPADPLSAMAARERKRVTQQLVRSCAVRMRNGTDCDPAGRSLALNLLALLVYGGHWSTVESGHGRSVTMTLNDERGTMKVAFPPKKSFPELPCDASGIVIELKCTTAPERVLDISDLKALPVVVTSKLGLFESHRFIVPHSDVGALLARGDVLLRSSDEDSRSYEAAMRVAAELDIYHQTLLTCGAHLPSIVLQWPQRRRDLTALVAWIVKKHGDLENLFSYGPHHELELAI